MTWEILNKQLFWLCVDVLSAAADKIGITYEELNVWIFIVGMPGIILILSFILWFQKRAHYRHIVEMSDRNQRLALRWINNVETHFRNENKDQG